MIWRGWEDVRFIPLHTENSEFRVSGWGLRILTNPLEEQFTNMASVPDMVDTVLSSSVMRRKDNQQALSSCPWHLKVRLFNRIGNGVCRWSTDPWTEASGGESRVFQMELPSRENEVRGLGRVMDIPVGIVTPILSNIGSSWLTSRRCWNGTMLLWHFCLDSVGSPITCLLFGKQWSISQSCSRFSSRRVQHNCT